jgi:hypothetical protein
VPQIEKWAAKGILYFDLRHSAEPLYQDRQVVIGVLSDAMVHFTVSGVFLGLFWEY